MDHIWMMDDVCMYMYIYKYLYVENAYLSNNLII